MHFFHAGGQDYGMLSTELVFTASTMQLCEVITIIDDDDVECDDVFTVELNTTDSNVDIPSDRESSNVSIALDDSKLRLVQILIIKLSLF